MKTWISTVTAGLAGGLAGGFCALTHADTLYDNGSSWTGSSAISNATTGVFGARRTVLDDFTIPEGRT